jgi:AAA domain
MQWHDAGWEKTKLRESEQIEAAVDSRRRALGRLRAAVLCRARGPLLLTGEPGAGKTWLSRRLVAGLPAGWRSSYVALTASLDALDFLSLAGHNLGLAQPNRVSTARLGLEAALRDEWSDGRNWILIVDDAQRGVPDVWEEVQVLGDRTGSPGGFAALLVLSQTELIRIAASLSFRSFAVSLNEHHHLGPLDLDEAWELLGLSAHTDEQLALCLEELHRDAAGNPRRLLHLAESRSAIKHAQTRGVNANGRPVAPSRSGSTNGNSFAPPAREHQPIIPSHETLESTGPIAAHGKPSVAASEQPIRMEKPSVVLSGPQAPALIPAKPPIRIEEGLVEVGWEGDVAGEYSGPDRPSSPSPQSAEVFARSTIEETVVDDHYAALQAWTERSNTRQPIWAEASPRGDQQVSAAVEEAETRAPSRQDEQDDLELEDAHTPAKIRAEGQHEFAPYSQLFTRLRQSS